MYNTLLRICLFNNTVTLLSYTFPHSWVIRILLPFWVQFWRILSSKRSFVLETLYYYFIAVIIFVWLLLLFTAPPPGFILHVFVAFPNPFQLLSLALMAARLAFTNASLIRNTSSETSYQVQYSLLLSHLTAAVSDSELVESLKLLRHCQVTNFTRQS